MKKIVTIGVLSILTAPAMAQTKWFVDGGVGYTRPVLANWLEGFIDEYAAQDNRNMLAFEFGSGVRFYNKDKIFNWGTGLYLSHKLHLGNISGGGLFYEDGYDFSTFYMEASMDVTTLYWVYDNYLRVSDNERRVDFVASLGFGTSWFQWKGKQELNERNYTDEISLFETGRYALFVLKFGIEGETGVDGLWMNLLFNIDAPIVSDDDSWQRSFGVSYGMKYLF